MAKKNNNYFKMIEEQMSYCIEASNLLEEILHNFNADHMTTYRTRMHEIEHTADKVYHDILNKLFVEFITPIDQEDIIHLSQIIDDITDALDEIILEFYMYHIDSVPDKAVELSKVVNSCIVGLQEAIGELKNFKKPVLLRSLVIKVNDIETEADEIYTEAIYNLFGSSGDVKSMLGTKAIYDSLESCCDLCEHATNVIEQIIIKNT